MNNLTVGIYRFSEWIMRLAYINILWIFFTILGLGLFGLFPATSAMFSVIRRLLVGDTDLPIFKSFYNYMKRDFKQANILGYILVVLGLLLYFDIRFFQTSTHILFNLLTTFSFILLFIYFIMTLYIFPIFVHYNFKTLEYIKYTLIIAIGRPVLTIMMIVGVVLVYTLFDSIPGLFPFFGASCISCVLLWIASFSLPKLEESSDYQS